jgi:hypothetical protein
MALPVSFYSLTQNDNTSVPRQESTNTGVAITTLTAGNLTAQLALISGLENALEGICLGNPSKSEVVLSRVVISTAPASDPQAQRETKWLIRYHGTTLNEKFQVTLGTADLDQLTGGSEFLSLGAGTGAALVAAWAAIVKSPGDAGEATAIDSVQFVGRNT